MSRSLGAYQLKLVGSPAYFARAAIPSTLKHLAGHACLHRKNPATGRLQHWPLAAADDIALPTTAIASTIDALVSLAEHGAGIACVPDFSVRQQIEDGSLLSVLREEFEHTESLRAVWPHSPYLPPKLRVFIDFLASNLLPKTFRCNKQARAATSSVPNEYRDLPEIACSALPRGRVSAHPLN